MLLSVAALTLSSSVPAAAIPADPARVACVPLRDGRGRPTGGRACKTAAEWRSILKASGLRREVNWNLHGSAFPDPTAYSR